MVQDDIHRSLVLHLNDVGKTKDTRWFCYNPFLPSYKAVTEKAFFACSGNGNSTSWNNRGTNGYYWASSLNSATNGRNLNFNSGGVNPQNYNGRFNGFAVRAVQHTILNILLFLSKQMTLTHNQLLLDLYQAYYDAKRHKTSRSYVRKWEMNLKENMESLCNDLLNRTYKAMPSKCFIVDYPKKREIFAAMFRDRIVHHLYFNYTHKLYERTFIQDAYSCIKGRGTHYGINRINDFCRKESRNWQRKCYVMHLDIRGYFMHINRKRLLDIAVESLTKMSAHNISKDSEKTWADILDMDLILWLTEKIVTLDPKSNCVIVGDKEKWIGLDPAKSMLNLEDGLGLPIGNLTSQLFSNVYLNKLDQFMKRVLGCKYYGRYVDDAAVVSADKKWLMSIVEKVKTFLKDDLQLELHMGKLKISEVHRGVEFLGAFIKPWRIYICNEALERMKKKIKEFNFKKPWHVVRSVNSYLGIFQHVSSYNLCRKIFMTRDILTFCVFNPQMTKCKDRLIFYQSLKNNNYEQGLWK